MGNYHITGIAYENQPYNDLGDVVEIVYLSIDLFTIFNTADVETPVFLAISAMGIPYFEKSLIAIRNRILFLFSFSEN